MDLRESRFESDIESYILTYGGYAKGDPAQFDRTLALDTKTLFAFIRDTQPKTWKRHEAIYGGDAERAFLQRLDREIRQSGLLRVLRQGISDRGQRFRLVFWKPETGINPETAKLYEKNILHCTRQLHYSPSNENSIDMVLFLNGIPVVTMELKNQFTGQTVRNAMEQYRTTRSENDPIFDFKNRALVHFCVDLYEVQMTTRLQGEKTRFLPFNQGSGGAGKVGGAGNPPAPNDNTYATAYLWENVLCKDRLLEILHKYMHFDAENGVMIFPRYHQLDVVTKLLREVKQHGAGNNYLIQHSAGSGKSNSIAWLAHRLSGLHDNNDKKIFGSVIVITDRKVLDSQLQDTIYQFDHVDGVVEKIDQNSAQLLNAINSGVPIIITTLQKFPIIYKEVNASNKNYALIVDEAHSSQTGEAAKKLKAALADTDKVLEEYAQMESEWEESTLDEEDKLAQELAAQGQHGNLSFFAFTATPKTKTLQMFGTLQSDGEREPFHVYSMRQAIEENFILDVLAHYTTYKTYYKIIKNVPDDPEIDTTDGIRAITRYESLHPHNIAQKAAIILKHFYSRTHHEMEGRAKAMVVTASRLHAVRYYLEFQRQIASGRYPGIGVLVAFSGEVEDEGGPYTEEKLNKDAEGKTVKESQLPKVFHSEDFNLLIVAEKYQTGFDEPLLHTMFVDKKLKNVKAVQTLSRLNRTAAGKNSTFVLDFANTAEEMQEAFQPFYETTILEKDTDPNLLYDQKRQLDDSRIYTGNEVEHFADVYYKGGLQSDTDMGALSSLLKPAIDRYSAKDKKEKDEFKATLNSFIRLYSFITQVVRMFDAELQRFHIYAKFLYKVLPKREKDPVDLDGKLLLEYYRVEKDFDGSVQLEEHEHGKVQPIVGGIKTKEEQKDSLSAIIDRINERTGTNFTEMDKLIQQVQADFKADATVKAFALDNDEEMFARIYPGYFRKILAGRFQQNNEFMHKLFSDEKLLNYFMDSLQHEIYMGLRQER